MPSKKTMTKKTVKSKVTEMTHKDSSHAIQMQLYWLIYNVALQPDVMELLETSRVEAYTTWKEVNGKGRSGPHSNDDVWPGVNAMFMLAAPKALEKVLAQGVRKIREEFPGEGIKLIVQPCAGIY